VDRFVVGTGRCGSTLLSRMLAASPQVLSVFEFFNGLDVARRFGAEPVAGAQVAELISQEQPFLSAVLRRGYAVPEVVYPFDRGRYRREDPLPWVLVSLLPRLVDDPDALFDESVAWLAERGRLPIVEHYRALLDFWVQRLGRELWVERSGSSLDYVDALATAFPEARFVHLHREGPEVALSMRGFAAYRLPVAVMYDVATERGMPLAELGDFDLQAAPRGDDAVSQILASPPPVEVFGRYWSDQIERGSDALARLDPARVLSLRFEQLAEEAAPQLRRVADFFEIDSQRDSWISRAAALTRGMPPRRLAKLAPDARARLLEACEPGTRRLGGLA